LDDRFDPTVLLPTIVGLLFGVGRALFGENKGSVGKPSLVLVKLRS